MFLNGKGSCVIDIIQPWLLGSFRNNGGDGNENGKKSLIS